MRAVIITEPGGPEVLKIQDIQEPTMGPEDVLIEIKATALNRADLAQRMGRYPAPEGIRNDMPGLEMAGVVLRVGDRVYDVSEGDRVFGLLNGGGYAERVVTHHRMIMRIPENLNYVEAASIPEVFFTSYDALFNQCSLGIGERVLIHAGGSGVGTAAIQLAHCAGATTFATIGSQEKLSKARELGLDIGINYHEEDFSEVIKEMTMGQGVHVILDVVGAPYWEKNLNALATLGRMVLVGYLGGGRLETNIALLSPKRLKVQGTVLRARPIEEKIALTRQIQQHVVPLLSDGTVKPVVDSVFPLSKCVEAHEYMESNANFGKIVLTID